MRRRLRRAARRRPLARGRRTCARRARAARAPGSGRRRRGDGRRRRDPGAAAARMAERLDLPWSLRRRRALSPPDRRRRQRRPSKKLLVAAVEAEGQEVLGWRDVPVEATQAGATAQLHAPVMNTALRRARRGCGRPGRVRAQALRDPACRRAACGTRSGRAELLVAHGRLQGDADGAAAPAVLPRSAGSRLRGALALVHSRFSTNTFPTSWPIRIAWSRTTASSTPFAGTRTGWAPASHSSRRLFGDDLQEVHSGDPAGGSDSATFDSVSSLLVLSGRLPHALTTTTPEAHVQMLPARARGLLRLPRLPMILEPWDGGPPQSPASPTDV